MKIKKLFLIPTGLIFLVSTKSNAQIAINNSAANPDPSAILDLQSGNSGVNKGFLPQAVALTDVTVAAPVVSPATGLIVYSNLSPAGGNGTGYYYWTGTVWASLNSTITGAGTTDYVARWTPNGSMLGIGMIQDNGSNVGINSAPMTGTMLYVQNGAGTGVTGIGTASGDGVYGLDSANIGVNGLGIRSGAIGVFGTGDSGAGVYGSSAHGYAVLGLADDINAIGVIGENLASAGVGIYGYGDTAAAFYGDWNGVNAYSANNIGVNGQGATYGVYGLSTNVANAGVYGQDDNNVGVYGYSANLTGVYGQGDNNIGVEGSSTNQTGVYGVSTNGTAVVGISTNVSGLYAESDNGNAAAVISFYPTSATQGAAITTNNTLTGNQVSVNYFDGLTTWKITGGGTVGTVVKDDKGEQVRLACPESPEIMFEDYGEGQLVNGVVHITLDPTIAKNVTINEKHPLRVFIQLYDNENCKGVIVKNRTASGFDVVELNHGNSNTAFSWHIVCNRADEQLANGKVSHNADIRYAKVVEDKNSTVQAKSKNIKPQTPAKVNANNSNSKKHFAPLNKVGSLGTAKNNSSKADVYK